MPRTCLFSTALAWALAPWVEDVGVLVLVASIGTAWLIRHESAWWMGLFLAPLPHLAWLPDTFHDAFGWSLSTRWTATLLATALHASPWWMFLGLARWGRTTLPLWSTLGVAAAITEGTGLWISPTPTLHALLAAETGLWILPAAVGGRALASGVLAAWGGWTLEQPRLAAAFVGIGLVIGSSIPDFGDRLRIGVVQTGVPAWEARIHSRAAEHEHALRQQMDAVQQAAFIVTPEGAWPQDVGRADGARRRAFWADWTLETPVLLGSTTGRRPPFSNTVWVVDPPRLQAVSKQHLVPGWETPRWGFGEPRYRAGTGSRVVSMGVHRVGIAICYEDVFESTFREPADLWVVSSDDSWLGRSGRATHLNAARLAAVSTGRSVVRSTTDGTTLWIDRWGRGRDALPVDGEGSAAVWSVSVGGIGSPGVWVSPWLSWFAAAIALVSRRLR